MNVIPIRVNSALYSLIRELISSYNFSFFFLFFYLFDTVIVVSRCLRVFFDLSYAQ